MTLTRRTTLALLAAVVASPVAAQGSWPDRPIRMVIPYAAGGATDVIGRLVAEGLSTRLGQRVVVENRTGAGGNIGASYVAKAAGDGYTLLFTNTAHAVNPVIYPRLDYDPMADLTPVSIVAESPMVLLVPAGAPWQDVAAFVAAGRAERGKLTYGSTGSGGALQLVSLLFARAAGITFTEVPYRGGAPAALDLAAGRIDMLYDAGATGFALAKGGQARALAISSGQRSPVMPDVPTIAEAGFPAATFGVWQAILVPTATPAAIQERLSREIAAVLADPATKQRLADLGAERLIGNDPAAARDYVKAEVDRWTPILTEAGVKAQ